MQHGSLITVSEVCTIAAFVLSVEAIAVDRTAGARQTTRMPKKDHQKIGISKR